MGICHLSAYIWRNPLPVFIKARFSENIQEVAYLAFTTMMPLHVHDMFVPEARVEQLRLVILMSDYLRSDMFDHSHLLKIFRDSTNTSRTQLSFPTDLQFDSTS